MRPRPRFDVAAPPVALRDLGRVYLIAIGGAGMSAVARLLRDAGVSVSGSDSADSASLKALRADGIDAHVGHDPARLAGVDTVVVSSAVPESNPELAAARANGLRILHRSQALASLASAHRRIAVAGANGKTTTSAMIAWVLSELGRDPSYAIGATIPGLGANAAWGTGAEFVIEADESDGSFLAYRPDVAVITNVQPDHLDYYGTFENVQTAYADFVGTLQSGGVLIACGDDEGARSQATAARSAGREVATYGVGRDNDLVVVPSDGPGLNEVTFEHGQAKYEVALAVPGPHNALNAAAAFLACVLGCGTGPSASAQALSRFSGAARRFEVRGEERGVLVVDDYAHNAPKVAAFVSTAVDLARSRGGLARVIFQPHLFSRTRDFAQEFALALAPATQVAVLPVYGAREQPIPGVTSALITNPLEALAGERTVLLSPDGDAAVEALVAASGAGDVVATVGAGDVTGLGDRLLTRLGDTEAAGGARA